MVRPSFCERACIAGQLALQVHGSRSGRQQLCSGYQNRQVQAQTPNLDPDGTPWYRQFGIPRKGTMYEIAQDESTTCHQKCSSISVSTGVRFDDLNVGMPSIG